MGRRECQVQQAFPRETQSRKSISPENGPTLCLSRVEERDLGCFVLFVTCSFFSFPEFVHPTFLAVPLPPLKRQSPV